MRKLSKALLASLLLSSSVFADVLTIRDDAPSQYVVKKGDTLWDISGLYLNTPWKWPELWGQNPQIENPHLIFPGDILRLVYTADGQPRLIVASNQETIKVSPTKRTKIKRYQPVETLPLGKITPYLNYERILVDEDFDNAPQVVGGNKNTKRKIAGDLVYTDGELDGSQVYGIYRRSRTYKTDDGRFYELKLAGTAVVESLKDEETKFNRVRVRTSHVEISQGDRLFTILSDQAMPVSLTLTKPEDTIAGEVIASSNHGREFSKFEVAVVDQGLTDGVKAGDVFGIFRQAPAVVYEKGVPKYKEDASVFTKIFDSVTESNTMPVEQIGRLVVFKIYDHISYGLIMETEQTIRVDDKIKAPVR